MLETKIQGVAMITRHNIHKITILSAMLSLCFASFGLMAASAENSKELKNAEKCLDKVIKEETKKNKPKATSVIKACEQELEALIAYLEQTGDTIPPGLEHLGLGNKKKLDSIN